MGSRSTPSVRAMAVRRWTATIALLLVLATIVASGWYGASWSSTTAPPRNIRQPPRSVPATRPFTSVALAGGTVIVQFHRTGSRVPLRNGVWRMGEPDLTWTPLFARGASIDYYRVPLWPLAALLGVPVFIAWRRFRRRRAAGRECMGCGYPVGSSDVCTECGAALGAPRA